jgi:hypothetical protein
VACSVCVWCVYVVWCVRVWCVYVMCVCVWRVYVVWCVCVSVLWEGYGAYMCSVGCGL